VSHNGEFRSGGRSIRRRLTSSRRGCLGTTLATLEPSASMCQLTGRWTLSHQANILFRYNTHATCMGMLTQVHFALDREDQPRCRSSPSSTASPWSSRGERSWCSSDRGREWLWSRRCGRGQARPVLPLNGRGHEHHQRRHNTPIAHTIDGDVEDQSCPSILAHAWKG
jgi:hypothetical protein